MDSYDGGEVLKVSKQTHKQTQEDGTDLFVLDEERGREKGGEGEVCIGEDLSRSIKST